ncbi:MAG: alpha/beta hydrolase [Alphaproteobacteria bacterium]|nr:alpha/beta hydrolase [Alphaproteobacteria bacterium]
MVTTYRGQPAEELERQYNPRIAVPNFAEILARHQSSSAAARALLEPKLDVRYGPGPKATLDLFKPTRADLAPTLLFFHGGYWRNLDKSDYSLVAPPLVAAGALVILVNYDLCPTVSLDHVVEQTYESIAWTARHAVSLGADADRIYVAGNSAGAHLAAMAAARDWRCDGLPVDLIKGCVAITGIYDIAPVLDISVNADIRLDGGGAWRNSPMFRPPRPGSHLVVAVGAEETSEWQRQAVDYAAVARANGVEVFFDQVAGANHFSITENLNDRNDRLVRATLALMALA